MGPETGMANHHLSASLHSAPQQSHKMSIWLHCTLIFKLRRRSMPQIPVHEQFLIMELPLPMSHVPQNQIQIGTFA